MKRTAAKKFSAVILAVIIIFSFSVSAFAETIQDRIERQLQELVDKYQSAEPETQESIQERFNKFLEENGLDDIDLSKIQDTDIAKIIEGLGDNLSLDQFFGLAQDAWNSGLAMIQDVFNGGNGTSDGSNTANPNSNNSQYNSPNVIVPAATTTNSGAAGNPTTIIPPVTAENNTQTTTVPNIIGAGITVAEPASQSVITDDSGLKSSSVVVFVVLSVSTIAVLAAIIVFFVLKRR